MQQDQKTHFGYRQVEADDKATLVRGVFDSVADRYDIMNDLMSLGSHRLWKRFAVDQSGARYGHRVLDLAGGTGDLTALLSPRVGPDGEVVLADINEAMLRQGRDRLADEGLIGNVRYALANAESLPFEDESFHSITIAFGLRNVTDKDKALRSMHRVLRPGGRLIVLEFSRPRSPALNGLYDLYSFTALPAMGQVIAGDAESYRYLAESIRMHPDQDTLKGMMENAGFDMVSYNNLSGGIVALHKGIKF